MHRFDLDAAQAVSLLVQLSKEQHNSLEAVARLLLAGDQRRQPDRMSSSRACPCSADRFASLRVLPVVSWCKDAREILLGPIGPEHQTDRVVDDGTQRVLGAGLALQLGRRGTTTSRSQGRRHRVAPGSRFMTTEG